MTTKSRAQLTFFAAPSEPLRLSKRDVPFFIVLYKTNAIKLFVFLFYEVFIHSTFHRA